MGNVMGNVKNLIYLIESIKKLSGIQKNIFLNVINICTARSALDTGNISSIDLASAASCSRNSAKTSLIRLIKKNLILRLQGKACRGGYMVLGISEEIQVAALQAQQALLDPLKMLQPNTIRDNRTYSKNIDSSVYKNTIPEEWEKIDFEPLQHIGFSKTQLWQLFESHATTSEIVQDSIHHFAYGLEHNGKVKAYSEPLNVLMGVLRKGGRWCEHNYLTKQELALRQILEEKRKRKIQFEAMKKELIDLEFPDWRKKLTEDEIKQIVPPEIIRSNLALAMTAALRTYYLENILLLKLNDKKMYL